MTAEAAARGPLVIGLDLSLSATGIAYVTGSTTTIKVKPATMRGGERLYTIRRELVDVLKFGCDLLVIEDYAPGAVGMAGKLANAELHGITLEVAYRLGIDAVAKVRPSALKRWATGNGAAKKDEMVAAALAAGWTGDPKRHDEADAFHLRAMGLCALTGSGTAVQRVMADQVAWPSVRRIDQDGAA